MDGASTTGAPGAAGNTATSGELDQSLLNPQGSAPTPGAETKEGAGPTPGAGAENGAAANAAHEGENKGEGDGPLLSPEGGKPEDKGAPAGAPETYTEFNLPEGFELKGEILEETTALFKGLNLSQENAQKLVDYYTERVLAEKTAMLNDLAARRSRA